MNDVVERGPALLMTDRGLMSRSQYVGLAMARTLRERGIWRKGDAAAVVLDRLRDMAALSKAAIGAMEDWDAQVLSAALVDAFLDIGKEGNTSDVR